MWSQGTGLDDALPRDGRNSADRSVWEIIGYREIRVGGELGQIRRNLSVVTKHFLFVIKPPSGPHLTVPIGELAVMALNRVPEVANTIVERQTRLDAVLTFETV